MTHLRTTVSYGNLAGSVYQNVWNWLVTPDINPVAETDVLFDMKEVHEALYGKVNQLWSDDTRTDEMRHELWNPGTGKWDLYAIDGSTNIPGTYAAQPLPGGICALVSASMAGGGRSARKFIGGLSEVASLGDRWTSATLVALIALNIQWYSSFTATNGLVFMPEVFSAVNGTFTPIVPAGHISVIPAYQRRRKPGVGI